MNDVKFAGGQDSYPLNNRGHVIAAAYMCALDTIASYGYRKCYVEKFIKEHFRSDYKPFADRIYLNYRNMFVHTWNLGGIGELLPGSEPIKESGTGLSFGILNFKEAFEEAVNDFLDKLNDRNSQLKTNTLKRYEDVRQGKPKSK